VRCAPPTLAAACRCGCPCASACCPPVVDAAELIHQLQHRAAIDRAFAGLSPSARSRTIPIFIFNVDSELPVFVTDGSLVAGAGGGDTGGHAVLPKTAVGHSGMVIAVESNHSREYAAATACFRLRFRCACLDRWLLRRRLHSAAECRMEGWFSMQRPCSGARSAPVVEARADCNGARAGRAVASGSCR
jgi:hypothetical protein